MKAHQTDEHGFYVGLVETTKCPMTGSQLLPRGATYEEPPILQGKQVAQFKAGKWQIIDDLRGVKYWLDGKQLEIKLMGEALPPGAELEEPAEIRSEREALEQKQEVIGELSLIDSQTIRAMREYIASKADAPQILKDRELLAQQTRAKLK